MSERHAELKQMIQEVSERFPPDFGANGRIIDFIMSYPDLELTSDQIRFFLRSSTSFCPDREDYFAVLGRMLSESRRLGDMELVKRICASIPFYPEDKDFERKSGVIRDEAENFLAAGKAHDAGELYMHLAWSYVGIDERLKFCELSLEYLDKSSEVYAAALALRRMLFSMKDSADKMHVTCFVFGEKLLSNDGCILVTPMPYAWYICDPKEKDVFFNIPVLKGYNENLNPWGYKNDNRVIADTTLAVGASNGLYKENELVRFPDEKVICPADGKEYDCYVFSYVSGDTTVKNYFADKIGLVRTVVEGDGRYVFDLCEYDITGGEGLLPLCAGNRWRYIQSGRSDRVKQTAEREIVSEHGGKYLLSGIDYAERI